VPGSRSSDVDPVTDEATALSQIARSDFSRSGRSVAFGRMKIERSVLAGVSRRARSIPTGALAAIAALLWLGSGLYMVRFGSSWHLDLRVYRAAGHELFSGGNPFIGVFTANKLPFTYPPFALLVLSPLAFGPLWFVESLWWLLSSLALVAVLFVLLEAERGARRAEGGGRGGRAAGTRSLAVAAAIGAISTLALEPVRSNMNYGQINVLLMVVVVVDLTRPASKWRGVLVGLAAAIKLTPLVYLGYFALRRDRASLVRGLATFAVATALSWLALPAESARYWFHEAFDAKRTGDVGGVTNQSWEGLLNRAPFHGGGLAAVLYLVLAIATIGYAVPLVRRLQLGDRPAETVLALALVELLISPISWTHHWSWLVIAPLVVVSLWNRHRLVATLFAVLLALGVTAPYLWSLHGVVSEFANDSLVLAGALTLLVWRIAESRGAPA
jgi:alpha-1,2-mannosyltransferase